MRLLQRMSQHFLKQCMAQVNLGVLGGLLMMASGVFSLQASAQTMPHESTFNSIGTVNCTSSTCHGSIRERESSNVLQTEYIIWLQQDAHTNAYNVLLNKQSRRIAKNLGLKVPANKANVCLDCHAHNPPPARRGERFDQTDGVNCEACHGPAEKWVKTHVEPDPSHQKNIEHGLYPTSQPEAVAKLCLSCHQGDATRPITHQIMGAGHPRLTMELDTFLALQPPHYVIDDDWRERKGAYSSGKIWAIGQFVASETLLDLISDPKRNSQGLMPEFIIFDCHACHASMEKMDWRKGMASAPGQPRINDSSLLMVSAIVKGALPKDYDQFSKLVTALHATSTSPQATMQDVIEASNALRAYQLKLRKKVMRTQFGPRKLSAVLKEILAIASRKGYPDYAGAEQAYMSISSVANALSKTSAYKLTNTVNPSLETMLKLLKEEDTYDRRRFEAELAKLNKKVGAQSR